MCHERVIIFSIPLIINEPIFQNANENFAFFNNLIAVRERQWSTNLVKNHSSVVETFRSRSLPPYFPPNGIELNWMIPFKCFTFFNLRRIWSGIWEYVVGNSSLLRSDMLKELLFFLYDFFPFHFYPVHCKAVTFGGKKNKHPLFQLFRMRIFLPSNSKATSLTTKKIVKKQTHTE